MARKISIGELAGKATLNAQPYIDALKQAERETKKSTEKASGFFDRMGNEFRRKWTRPGMFKDILQGVGIGGGFAAAQTAASTIAGQWEKAAEMAKKVEDSTARQLKFTQDAIKASQTDREREQYLIDEIAKMDRQLAGWKSSRLTLDVFSPSSWGENFRAFLNDTDKSELATTNILELTEAMQQAGAELANLRKKMSAEDVAKYDAAMQRLIATEKEMTATLGGAFSVNAAPSKSLDMDTARARQMALLSEITQLRDIGNRMPMGQEKIDTLTKVNEKTAELIQLNKLLGQEEDRVRQKARWMGDAIASSFEYAIFSGQGVREMLRGMAQDFLQIAFRSAITEPLGKWVGGMFTGMFGGGKATGGPVSAGTAYMVGEKGPELFVPSTAGRIETNASLGKGGGTYYIDARGADRTGLAQLEAMIAALHGSIEPRAVAAVVDAQRRRLMPAV